MPSLPLTSHCWPDTVQEAAIGVSRVYVIFFEDACDICGDTWEIWGARTST